MEMEEEEWKEGGDVKRVEDDEGDEFPEMKRSALEREENFLKLLIAIEGFFFSRAFFQREKKSKVKKEQKKRRRKEGEKETEI